MSKAAACLEHALKHVPPGGRVLDAGCGDFRILREHAAALEGRTYVGCDATAQTTPPGVEFRQCNLDQPPLPFEDDSFDLVIFSHVIEHLANPVAALGELVRVLKPGGSLFVECPSEKSLRPGPWAPPDFNLILSFHDDPTHGGRPWSPQALRRAAIYMGCKPLETHYDQSLLRALRLPFDWAYGLATRNSDHLVTSWWLASGWVSYALIRKPETLKGAPAFNYRSFRGVPPGDDLLRAGRG